MERPSGLVSVLGEGAGDGVATLALSVSLDTGLSGWAELRGMLGGLLKSSLGVLCPLACS